VLNLPVPQTIRANTVTTINGIFVNDSDALQGDGLLEITLAVQNGTLTLSTLAGVFFAVGDGVSDRTMQFTGSLPSVTAALSGLIYKPNADTLEPDLISVNVSDLGNTGAGGVLTASGNLALNPLENQIVVQPNPLSSKLQDLVIYGKSSSDDKILIKGGGTTFKVSLDGGATFLPSFKKVSGRILVFGLSGNDEIKMPKVGRIGILSGGVGNDTLEGGSKNDRLSGGADQDSLIGGKGIDRLVESANGDFTLIDGSLSGALGNDTLSLIEEAELTGGDGDNTINASTFSGKTFLFGGDGDDTLTGGKGGGLIVGGAGNDSMIGGIGRDVLIGGLGADILKGGAGEDLLIGGTTIHDGNKVALDAIVAEWHHKSRKYADRISRLEGAKPKGLNKTFFLTTTTVINDGSINDLKGEADLDYFFANGLDTTDAESTETKRMI